MFLLLPEPELLPGPGLLPERGPVQEPEPERVLELGRVLEPMLLQLPHPVQPMLCLSLPYRRS